MNLTRKKKNFFFEAAKIWIQAIDYIFHQNDLKNIVTLSVGNFNKNLHYSIISHLSMPSITYLFSFLHLLKLHNCSKNFTLKQIF